MSFFRDIFGLEKESIDDKVTSGVWKNLASQFSSLPVYTSLTKKKIIFNTEFNNRLIAFTYGLVDFHLQINGSRSKPIDEENSLYERNINSWIANIEINSILLKFKKPIDIINFKVHDIENEYFKNAHVAKIQKKIKWFSKYKNTAKLAGIADIGFSFAQQFSKQKGKTAGTPLVFTFAKVISGELKPTNLVLPPKTKKKKIVKKKTSKKIVKKKTIKKKK